MERTHGLLMIGITCFFCVLPLPFLSGLSQKQIHDGEYAPRHCACAAELGVSCPARNSTPNSNAQNLHEHAHALKTNAQKLSILSSNVFSLGGRFRPPPFITVYITALMMCVCSLLSPLDSLEGPPPAASARLHGNDRVQKHAHACTSSLGMSFASAFSLSPPYYTS